MKSYQHAKMLKLFVLSLIFLVAAAACVPDGYYEVLVNMKSAGVTDDGVEYDSNDILFMDIFDSTPALRTWVTFFDGEAYGLTDKKHNISAFSFDDWIPLSELEPEIEPTDLLEYDDLYLSFEANRVPVPGVAGRVTGNDVVKFRLDTSGPEPVYAYELYFDGSDVGLSTVAEKIDGLTVMPADEVPSIGPDEVQAPYDCHAGILFVSTRGSYRVPNNMGGNLTGDGSDVLAFCATNTGVDTAGFWFRLFDGSDAGLKPRNAVNALDVFTLEDIYTPDDSGTAEFGVGFIFASDKEFTASGGVTGLPPELFGGGSIGAPSWVEGPVANFNDGSEGPALNGIIEDIVLDEDYP